MRDLKDILFIVITNKTKNVLKIWRFTDLKVCKLGEGEQLEISEEGRNLDDCLLTVSKSKN